MIKDHIANETPCVPYLPLSCVVSLMELEDFVKRGVLKTPSRGFYQGKHLCFFYGMPFLDPQPECNRLESSVVKRPVGILFKGTMSKRAKTVYPTNTQPFENGSKFLLELDYLTIPVQDGSEPAKVVSRYYDSNKNFVRGEVKNDIVPKDAAEISFVRLLELKVAEAAATRVHMIEVHFSDAILMAKQDSKIPIWDYIDLLILPELSFEKNKNIFGNAIQDIKKIYYKDIKYEGPAEDAALIRSEMLKYLEQNGY